MRLRTELREINTAGEIGWWTNQFSAGSEGFLRWLTLCGWTYDPRAPVAERHRPFIPWPIQRRVAAELWCSIEEGHDVLIDKSRDMGASWLCLAALVWFWQFVPDTPILAASRKQQYVDERGNPDTLFWKLRYLIYRQPEFLVPPVEDRQLHLGNKRNGSSLDGESTNADLGRGGRRKAILLDEFAAVDFAEANAILSATADATPCRIYNSTPQGRVGAFADVRFGGKTKVITLHWKDHPVKGMHSRVVDGKWTSPWYESECARRVSKKEIAQELDIDYLASGGAFFDLDVLQRLRASGNLRPALDVGEIVNGKWELGKRRAGLWVPLKAGRPMQDRNYAAFADIAHGTGASNSVLIIADVQTREAVCVWASADTPPHEFAEQAVWLCRWFGGQRPCLLGWEANGPGGIFGLEVHRLGYGCVLGNEDLTRLWRPSDGKIGWTSTPVEKTSLFGELRAAVARGQFIIHDEQTVVEMERYITDKNAVPRYPDETEDDPTGAGAAHGDRVVATAGVLLCLNRQAMARPVSVPVTDNTFLGRKRAYEATKVPPQEWG